MPQGALGLVAGEEEVGMGQDLEDGLPIVEQLHRQGSRFVKDSLSVFRAGYKPCEHPLLIDTSLTLEIPLVEVEESGHNVGSPLKGR